MQQETTSSQVKAYLICLGLSRPGRGDIVVPLIEDIRQVQPSYLGLICTEDSESTANRLMEGLGGDAPPHEIHQLPEAFDINETFRHVDRIIRNLRDDKGILPEEIAINYTSGTKVMAAGALLSGVFHEVMELRYLQDRQEEGSLAMVTLPSQVYRAREAYLAYRLATELRFQSASDILQSATETEPTSEQSDLVRLRELINGWGAWDNFQYQKALVCFNRALGILAEEEVMLPAPLMEVSETHLEQLHQLVSVTDAARFDVALLADLINNARRRLAEGKPNDAVTRAYRGLEMLAQNKLITEHDIDTNHVNIRRVPPHNRAYYEASRSLQDGRLRIGMRKSYELLDILNDDLGQRYTANNELREILASRYQSLLAHGYRTLSVAESERFVELSEELITSEHENFPTVKASLQFPWL
jgi:CRISPR-associated protein (TIGR02710 family)